MANTRRRSLSLYKPAQKRRIFQKYGANCIYCGDKATQIEHLVPWAYSEDDSDDNLVPACRTCNQIAGSMVFDTISEKREYILGLRVKRLRNVRLILRSEYNALGYTLKTAMKKTIILKNDEEMLHLQHYLKKIGVKYII